MTELTLGKQRDGYRAAREKLVAALEEVLHADALHKLDVPGFVALLGAADTNDLLAERLADLEGPRIARLLAYATTHEAAADRLVQLEFPRVLALLDDATNDPAATARLRALHLDRVLFFYKHAAEDVRFARNLELLEFPKAVRAFEDAFRGTIPSGPVASFDYQRLLRAIQAILAVERLVANPDAFDSQRVLRKRTDAAPPLTLHERLAAQPFSVDFFWSLRALQAAHPDRPKIGASRNLAGDLVRLRQEPDLAFASSTLRSFKIAPNGGPPELSVNFLGLFGPNGALPLHLTDQATDRLRENDATLVDFLNVFQHRSLSFFFRAWAVHQKTVDLDRPEDRRFANYIASFIGLGMPSLRGRDVVPDMAKLYFAGRLAPQAKNAEGLAAIIAEFFGVPCEIQNFFGHWITIPPHEVCRLGASPATGTLGENAIVGSRVFQYQTKFRIRLGPMHLPDLRRLLPCEDSWPRLKAWVANYIGYELAWDAQYVLFAREVPSTQLGAGALLGWTTWMVSYPPARDADDVIIDADLH